MTTNTMAITSMEYALFTFSAEIINSEIKKAKKSPHWETELYIDKAIASFEPKYCDVVYVR